MSLGARVLVDILNIKIKINLISMITTITRARIKVLHKAPLSFRVIVGVIVRDHQQ